MIAGIFIPTGLLPVPSKLSNGVLYGTIDRCALPGQRSHVLRLPAITKTVPAIEKTPSLLDLRGCNRTPERDSRLIQETSEEIVVTGPRCEIVVIYVNVSLAGCDRFQIHCTETDKGEVCLMVLCSGVDDARDG